MNLLSERYFQRILDKRQHILDLLMEKDEVEVDAQNADGVDTSRTCVMTSDISDKVSNVIVKLTMLNQRIQQEKNLLWDMENEYIKQIRELQNAAHITVLYDIYIKEKSYKEIADKTNHCTAWVRRKRKEALQHFEEVHQEYLKELFFKRCQGDSCQETKNI